MSRTRRDRVSATEKRGAGTFSVVIPTLNEERHVGVLLSDVADRVFVSDRRYREYSVARVFLQHLLMSLFFALGKFEWANHINYKFGDHQY